MLTGQYLYKLPHVHLWLDFDLGYSGTYFLGGGIKVQYGIDIDTGPKTGHAHSLGYKNHTEMTMEHDWLHTYLSVLLGHPWSPTLWLVANEVVTHDRPARTMMTGGISLVENTVNTEERLVEELVKILNAVVPYERLRDLPKEISFRKLDIAVVLKDIQRLLRCDPDAVLVSSDQIPMQRLRF